METTWFVALISAVCLEGLGRRYLPFIPGQFFYFLKDFILLFGYLKFRPSAVVTKTTRYLIRGFELVLVLSILWTVAELLNPKLGSFVLGLVGLRSYWLWWTAPPLIASALQNRRHKENAIYALLIISLIVAGMAAIQFASPASSSVNMYSVWNGEEIYAADSAIVATTGRARVASTFAYITGFVDFTILVPALLLSLGLDSQNPRVRGSALVATLVTSIVVPMSGSRSSVVIGLAMLAVMLWSAGLFFTRLGRRILIGSVLATSLAVVVVPEALQGVMDRFKANEEETTGRFESVAILLPPVAFATFDYPTLGIGTGMQQNARVSFNVSSEWEAEAEVGRYLIELGPIGYLFVWTSKLGLMVALLRAYAILKRAGKRGSAAAALVYAMLTMTGNLTFDHNWQALYFIGCGFILAEVVSLRQAAAAAAAAEALRRADTGERVLDRQPLPV